MFEPPLVTFSADTGTTGDGHLDLTTSTIIIDSNDFVGVKLAAQALANDLGRVTGGDAAALIRSTHGSSVSVNTKTAIIIGSLDSSTIIQALVQQCHIDVDAIKDKWECFTTKVINSPPNLLGCDRALVIAGSDKRGVIYGVYTLTEQIGVSP